MELEYAFYVNSYGGIKISEVDWKRVSQKAMQRLNSYTFGRLSKQSLEEEIWSNRVKCAICEISEVIYEYENREGKVSENTDGYAVSYDSEKSLGSVIYDVVMVHLGDSGLLYAGVEAC